MVLTQLAVLVQRFAQTVVIAAYIGCLSHVSPVEDIDTWCMGNTGGGKTCQGELEFGNLMRFHNW